MTVSFKCQNFLGRQKCCWRSHLCCVNVEIHVACGGDMPTAFQEACLCPFLKADVGYRCDVVVRQRALGSWVQAL